MSVIHNDGSFDSRHNHIKQAVIVVLTLLVSGLPR